MSSKIELYLLEIENKVLNKDNGSEKRTKHLADQVPKLLKIIHAYRRTSHLYNDTLYAMKSELRFKFDDLKDEAIEKCEELLNKVSKEI